MSGFASHPRVAFCFHDPEPSGATVWLRDFLCEKGYPADRAVAVLPGPSPIEPQLEAAGVTVRRIDARTEAMTNASAGRKVMLMGNRLSMIRQYGALFRRERVNMVYVNSSAQVAPMLAARLMRFPLLVHVHEAWATGSAHGMRRAAIRRLPDVAIFAASAGMDLFGPPHPASRWEVSPNGVDPALADLAENYQEYRKGYGWRRDDTVFLFLGSLVRRKGLHDLIRAWPVLRERYPRARLVVAGGTVAEETDPTIASFLAKPPDGAEYIGYRRDAHQLLTAADFLVLPSYGEAMPIAVSEALMIGTPVIAREVGDVGFQIGDGRGYLFSGKGAKPLLQEMARAIQSPADARERAERGQQFALDNLTKDQQYKQIRRLVLATAKFRRRREKP